MYAFGRKSLAQLKTLHPDLNRILTELIKTYDFSVQEGIRSAVRQNFLFTATPPRTTLDGYKKKSKHQGRKCKQSEAAIGADGEMVRDEDGSPICSYAVDITPYKRGVNPYSEKELDLRRFYFMMGKAKAISDRLFEEGKNTHRLRLGMDWDSDDIYTDQSFHDLPHLELV